MRCSGAAGGAKRGAVKTKRQNKACLLVTGVDYFEAEAAAAAFAFFAFFAFLAFFIFGAGASADAAGAAAGAEA
jgi:hypothetical protein